MAEPEGGGDQRTAKRDSRGGGNGAALDLGQHPPANLVAAVPLGISPGSSFRSYQGQHGISNQQNQPHATAHDGHPHPDAYIPIDYPSTMPSFDLSSLQQMSHMPLNSYNSTSEFGHGDKKPEPSTLFLDNPIDDEYNWRKYGHKMLKSIEHPRSYYRCSHQNCLAKKKVLHSFDGKATEIIYKGEHNHPPPEKEGGSLANVSDPRDDKEAGQVAVRTDQINVNEPDLERTMDLKNIESSESYRNTTKPKVIIQTTSEVDLLEDGYKWLKYGQKVIKGNPHPRSYYKCTNTECNVRKHVERAMEDPRDVITTYEGKHNHEAPISCRGIPANIVLNNNRDDGLLHGTDLRNNTDGRPFQLKKEDDGA